MNKGENMTINKNTEMETYILQYYGKELEDISTQLHEDIAQKIYAVFNHLQFLQQYIQDKQVRTRNEEMVKLTKETIEELRFLSYDILPFCQRGINGALEIFLVNYNKKHEIIVELHSYGEKQRLHQMIELIFYRLFKDTLNKLAEIFSVQSIEVTTFWEDSVSIRINYQVESESIEQHERIEKYIQDSETKLKVVGGSISIEKLNETNGQLLINIPNMG